MFWYYTSMTPREEAIRFKERFCRRMGSGLQLANMFCAVPGVPFFAKDEQSRFVLAGHGLLEIFNLQHEWEVLGKRDQDFYPPEIAGAFVEEDRHVMRTGRELRGYTQMVPRLKGPVQWRLVSKSPLRDPIGRICGVAVLLCDLEEIGGVPPPFERLEPALRHLHTHFGEPIETAQLAQLVDLSESQFTRLFRQLTGESPIRYLIRQRIQAGCRQLIATDLSISVIAMQCGFYDQSAFTRTFRKLTGKTPAHFRSQRSTERRFDSRTPEWA